MVDFNELDNGRVAQAFQKSFDKVIQNLADTRTPYKDKRSLVIKFVFQQNEERDDVSMDVIFKENLAHESPISTQFYTAVDYQTGEVILEEYGNGAMKGQMHIDDYASQEPTPIRKVVD